MSVDCGYDHSDSQGQLMACAIFKHDISQIKTLYETYVWPDPNYLLCLAISSDYMEGVTFFLPFFLGDNLKRKLMLRFTMKKIKMQQSSFGIFKALFEYFSIPICYLHDLLDVAFYIGPPLEIVKYLIHHGAKCYTDAASTAAEQGHVVILAFVLDNKYAVCTINDMELAVRHGHLDVVQILKSHGVLLDCGIGQQNKLCLLQYVMYPPNSEMWNRALKDLTPGENSSIFHNRCDLAKKIMQGRKITRKRPHK